MSDRLTIRRPFQALILTLLSFGLIGASGLLISLHATAITQMRDTGLPAAVEVPPLEKRRAMLKEQMEIAQLQRELAEGSEDEQLQTFVLPSEPDHDRIIEILTIVADDFRAAKWMRSMSAIHIDDAQAPNGAAIASQMVSFDAELTDDGLTHLQTLVRLSGLITIGDALSDQERGMLLRLTEEQSPAALAVLERFLRTPLTQYVREPRPFEDQVLRSFAGDEFAQSFAGILQHSLLAEVKGLLGGALGQSLIEHRLWPMRFLSLDSLEVGEGKDGWCPINMQMRAFQRSGGESQK